MISEATGTLSGACDGVVRHHDSIRAQHCVIVSQHRLQLYMQATLIRPSLKRQRDFHNDHCDLPSKRCYREEGFIEDYRSNRSPHFSAPVCRMLTVRNLDGEEKSLEIDDLVDMVLQVTKNLDDAELAQQLVQVSKRRYQNKVAAARYRDKQKERRQILLKEQAELEEKNIKLKETIKQLECEVAEYKRKLVQIVSDLPDTST
ncbi:unnamed protein product [Strongylus vulgaris]|uniref:BZIP domain-containing protein n=1 Tax=Strongylus vulgaris TaxID=40348 RepID=A0A3P7LG93_STRVU|nr:unnamed protein product [Strongylus vulgaris]